MSAIWTSISKIKILKRALFVTPFSLTPLPFGKRPNLLFLSMLFYYTYSTLGICHDFLFWIYGKALITILKWVSDILGGARGFEMGSINPLAVSVLQNVHLSTYLAACLLVTPTLRLQINIRKITRVKIETLRYFQKL